MDTSDITGPCQMIPGLCNARTQIVGWYRLVTDITLVASCSRLLSVLAVNALCRKTDRTM